MSTASNIRKLPITDGALYYWQSLRCRIHCISIWHLYGKLYSCRLFLNKISDLLIPLPKCCCNWAVWRWGDARQLMGPRRETQARVVREPAGMVQRVWHKGGHGLQLAIQLHFANCKTLEFECLKGFESSWQIDWLLNCVDHWVVYSSSYR